jgi:hypothetical protein
MGRNVEVIVSFGGLHEKHAVQRGVLGTNSDAVRTFPTSAERSTYRLENHGFGELCPSCTQSYSCCL